MSQQLMDRHLLRYFLVRIIGKMFADAISERKFPGLDQLRDSYRGKHLVHRPKVELRVQVDRGTGRLVGDAGGLTRDSYSILRDKDDAGKLVVGRQGIEVTLKFVSRFGLRL